MPYGFFKKNPKETVQPGKIVMMLTLMFNVKTLPPTLFQLRWNLLRKTDLVLANKKNCIFITHLIVVTTIMYTSVTVTMSQAL